LDFFKQVLELQNFYKKNNQKIVNSIQTNGILLNENWIDFFIKNNFQLGLSLDGPRVFHDYYRKFPDGTGSFDRVMSSISLIQSKKLNFGIISVLTDQNVDYPEDLLSFFVENNISNLNFGLSVVKDKKNNLETFSITAKEFSDFMIRLFECWILYNNKSIIIPRLQSYIYGVYGQKTTSCEFNDWCKHYLMFDYNGIVRACCSLPQDWIVGDLSKQSLSEIFVSDGFIQMNKKIEKVRKFCGNCKWKMVCCGSCPGYSFLEDKQKGSKNYFCSAHKEIYSYLDNKLNK